MTKKKADATRPTPIAENYAWPDGIDRTAQGAPALERERILNDAALTIFKGEAGQVFLKYLRNITTERQTGPTMSDAELRHLQGQQNLVLMIERRMEYGRRKRPSRPDE